MSQLLDELITLRRQNALNYQQYLERIRDLCKQVIRPEQTAGACYPATMDTQAKRAFYDNFGHDEVLATRIDTTIRYTKRQSGLAIVLKNGKLPTHYVKRPPAIILILMR